MTAATDVAGNTSRQRIAFVITDISGGGAARVAAILCGEWVAAGHEVHLITYERPGTAPVYGVDGQVTRHQLDAVKSSGGALGFAANNATRVRRLRRVLREIAPTGVIAFLLESNVTAVLAAWRLGVPVLISERTHPEHYRLPAAKEALRRFLYPRAHRLCVQSADVRDWYKNRLGIDSCVIANPVAAMAPSVSDEARPAGRRRRMIGLGRLEQRKGYDRVIAAFARVHQQAPLWDLEIFGEGPSRADLLAQAAQLGVAERVFLPGVTVKAFHEMQTADLFVHASRYEGYPNAVIEALAAGLCVIATDSPGAMGEILGGGHGLLVADDDIEALSTAMLQVMQDDALRSAYAAKAGEAIRKLEPAVIAQRWIDEIASCAGGVHQRDAVGHNV